jgi:hypothetical protein
MGLSFGKNKRPTAPNDLPDDQVIRTNMVYSFRKIKKLIAKCAPSAKIEVTTGYDKTRFVITFSDTVTCAIIKLYDDSVHKTIIYHQFQKGDKSIYDKFCSDLRSIIEKNKPIDKIKKTDFEKGSIKKSTGTDTLASCISVDTVEFDDNTHKSTHDCDNKDHDHGRNKDHDHEHNKDHDHGHNKDHDHGHNKGHGHDHSKDIDSSYLSSNHAKNDHGGYSGGQSGGQSGYGGGSHDNHSYQSPSHDYQSSSYGGHDYQSSNHDWGHTSTDYSAPSSDNYGNSSD